MITFVVGLAGTGKSFYCKNYPKRYHYVNTDHLFKSALVMPTAFVSQETADLIVSLSGIPDGETVPKKSNLYLGFSKMYASRIAPLFIEGNVPEPLRDAIRLFADEALRTYLSKNRGSDFVVEITDPGFIQSPQCSVIPDRIEYLTCPESIRIKRMSSRDTKVPDHLIMKQRADLDSMVADKSLFSKIVYIQ